MAERPAVRRALELKASYSFKHVVDQETRTALFAHT
jgi:hypothetical protein